MSTFADMPRHQKWCSIILVISLLGISSFFAIRLSASQGDPFADTRLFIFWSAVGGALLGGYCGFFWPGKSDKPLQQLTWTCADLFWLALSLFAVVKIMTPAYEALQRQDADIQVRQTRAVHSDLMRSLWRTSDKLCGSPEKNIETCSVLRLHIRQVSLPDFNEGMAKAMIEDYEKLCLLTCDPVIPALKNLAGTVALAFTPAAGSDNFKIEHLAKNAFIYFLIFVIVFAMRVGRTFAEFSRNFAGLTGFLRGKWGIR